MSTINLKMTIISIAVASLGSASYFAYSTLAKKQELFNEQVSKLSKSLPSEWKLTKESEKSGLFTSQGTYKLSFINSIDKKNNGSIVLNINAEHGLSSLFSGEVLLKGTTKIEGAIINNLKFKTSDGLLSKIEGVIHSDGNISIKELGSEIDITLPVYGENVNFKLKPFTGEIKYVNSTGEINKNISISEIKGKNENDSNITYTLKNTEFKYTSNINKLKSSKSSLNISSLDVPTSNIKVQGITINNSSEEKSKNQIIKLDSKVKKLNTKDYQDASLEFKVSLEGINKSLFTVYQDLNKVYLSKAKVYDHKSFLDGMNNGLTFNIEKFSLNSESAKAEVSGKYEIISTPENKSFSLVDQSKLNLNVTADSTLLSKIIGDSFVEETQNNELSIGINYSDRLLTVNNNHASEELNQSFIELLTILEKDNGLRSSSSELLESNNYINNINADKSELNVENTTNNQEEKKEVIKK